MSSADMTMPSNDGAKWQILVNLGNRFVLFGRESGLPEQPQFNPLDLAILPRVPEETTESAEARIVQTLQVSGMETRQPSSDADEGPDVELLGPDGLRILVEVKVRERDPNARDMDVGMQSLRQSRPNGLPLEVWFFNIERLKLTRMWLEGSQPKFQFFVPINVWEKTPEGVFERKRVVEEVEDWLQRLERLYAQIREWLSKRESLSFDETRKVTMSEDLMQKFAVADRELSILDVLKDNQVVVSFVPRGLWTIGAWGRVDIITRTKTHILVALKQAERYQWELATPENRRQTKPFDEAALLELVSRS